MSKQIANQQTEISTDQAPTARGKSVQRYIIPILFGATVWFALLGVGIDLIYSHVGAQQNSSKPKAQQEKASTAKVATTVTQQPVPPVNKTPEETTRDSLQMQDDRGQTYTVFLKSPKEAHSLQPSPGWAGTAAGDEIVSGDYEFYVQQEGTSDLRKQTVTLPGLSFNLNRKQVYVMPGHPQLLAVTQPGDSNGLHVRFFLLRSGVLAPVYIAGGNKMNIGLYMYAMKPLSTTGQYESAAYNNATGHWLLTTWQVDAGQAILREVHERDLGKNALAAFRNFTGVSNSLASGK